MLLLPDKTTFKVFHRRLPTMELLVYGRIGNTEQMFVNVANMNMQLFFDYPVPPTETIETTFRNILFAAHEKLFIAVQAEKAGRYVN